MNLLTRITATLTGTVDSMVSHVENHDAVVQAALKETRAAIAKARIRLSRVHKDGEALERRLAEATRMEALWAQRAVQSAQEDEAKALECIARRNHCRELITTTQDALARHKATATKMGESVAVMEQRLTTMTQQQHTMRSRQSTAEAQRVMNKLAGQSDGSIDSIFERWDMLVTEQEYLDEGMSDTDLLDAEFSRHESDADLKAELEALLEKQ